MSRGSLCGAAWRARLLNALVLRASFGAALCMQVKAVLYVTCALCHGRACVHLCHRWTLAGKRKRNIWRGGTVQVKEMRFCGLQFFPVWNHSERMAQQAAVTRTFLQTFKPGAVSFVKHAAALKKKYFPISIFVFILFTYIFLFLFYLHVYFCFYFYLYLYTFIVPGGRGECGCGDAGKR